MGVMYLLMVEWVDGSISHENATVKCLVQASVPQLSAMVDIKHDLLLVEISSYLVATTALFSS